MIVSAPAIEAWQLQKSFGKTTALAPLDLVVPRGAIFALVGHNGAGKTTLIKLLLNMIQPSGGSSSVFGSSSSGTPRSTFPSKRSPARPVASTTSMSYQRASCRMTWSNGAWLKKK